MVFADRWGVLRVGGVRVEKRDEVGLSVEVWRMVCNVERVGNGV